MNLNDNEKSFGGLVCPNCGKRLELRTSFDGLDEKAVEGKGFSYSVDLVCTVCSHFCPICRTNNKHAISKIISKDNNQYIRLSGTMSDLNQTINRLKNDYVFLSEPVFYMSRDSEIYHVNIECQRRNEHEHYKKRI